MITLKEIAQKCNVSIATVSNILNGKSNVSEETKNKVLKIIQETGYKPNYMARGLRATKSKTIGMIVDDITAFGSPKIIEGIMEICDLFGYRSIMTNLRVYSKWLYSRPSHDEYVSIINSAIEEMISLKVDGIIFVGAYTRAIDFIPSDLEIPVVIAYSFSIDNSIPSVFIDDVQSAYEMTNYIIKQGHKKIAVITGEKDGLHTELRFQGFKKAMAEHSIEVDESLITSTSWDFAGGYKACKEMNLADKVKSKEITALFCFNDLIAAGAYTYFGENGVKPGKDISIGGFDNQDIAECLSPLLTTMAIEVYEIGRKSAIVLLNKLKGLEPEENNLQIPSLLIERESVQQLKIQ